MRALVDAAVKAVESAQGKNCTVFVPPDVLAAWKRMQGCEPEHPLDYRTPSGQLIRIRASAALTVEEGKTGWLVMQPDGEVVS